MNRRSFIRSLGLGAAAVAAAPLLKLVPDKLWRHASNYGMSQIRFRNMPLVFSQYVPSNTVYFINPRWPHWRP